jgi:hypothetical protein
MTAVLVVPPPGRNVGRSVKRSVQAGARRRKRRRRSGKRNERRNVRRAIGSAPLDTRLASHGNPLARPLAPAGLVPILKLKRK